MVRCPSKLNDPRKEKEGIICKTIAVVLCSVFNLTENEIIVPIKPERQASANTGSKLII